jgi:hypothetical protein
MSHPDLGSQGNWTHGCDTATLASITTNGALKNAWAAQAKNT